MPTTTAPELKGIAGPSRFLAAACLVFAAVMIILSLAIGLAPVGQVTIYSHDGAVETFGVDYGKTIAAGETLSPVKSATRTVMPMKDLRLGARTALFAWATVPLLFLVWGLFGARLCFLGLAQGRFFATETARGLRTFAWGVLLYILAEPIAKFAAGPFLPVPDGLRALKVNLTFSSDTTIILIFTGAVILVSHALTRAAALAEENAQFV